MFYIGMAVVIVVLSGLVIWSDELARQQQLEDTIRSTKTRAEDEWDRWAQMVEELITGSSPPEEREERVKQFYRDRQTRAQLPTKKSSAISMTLDRAARPPD